MQIDADTEVSLFVWDRATDRLVFNSEAVRALGLSPMELKPRGAIPTIVPDREQVPGLARDSELLGPDRAHNRLMECQQLRELLPVVDPAP
jgi:PAS domain-containing protein